MSDYFSWYCVELRTRLAPHLPSAKVESIVREAECHLRESTEQLQAELHLNDEQAVLCAIEAFGSPEKVALTHLGTTSAKVLGLKPITFVFICTFVSLFCWVFHWLSLGGPFDNYGHTWQNGVAGFVGFLALIGFVVGCRAGRRSFRVPLAAFGLKFFVGALLFCAFWSVTDDGYQAVTRPRITAALTELPNSLERLDRFERYVLQGKEEFAKAKSRDELSKQFKDVDYAQSLFDAQPSYRSPQARGGVVTPSSFIYSMPDGRFWGIQETPSFKDAKVTWSRVDKTTIPGIASQRQSLTALLARVEEARSGRLFFNNGFLLLNAAGWIIVFMPVFFVIDAITFASVKRKRAWPVRGIA